MEEEKERKKQMGEKISEELEIDETNLEEELIRQPSKFFYWAMAWALAARKRRIQKLAAREVEAQATKEFKELVAKENPSLRITEKMISDFLAEHPTYKQSQMELINAEYTEDMLGGARDAFKARGLAVLELHKIGGDLSKNEFATMRAQKEELESRETSIRKRAKKTSQLPSP